jgi:hypothetical protein
MTLGGYIEVRYVLLAPESERTNQATQSLPAYSLYLPARASFKLESADSLSTK